MMNPDYEIKFVYRWAENNPKELVATYKHQIGRPLASILDMDDVVKERGISFGFGCYVVVQEGIFTFDEKKKQYVIA
jgi:hypothetical protein